MHSRAAIRYAKAVYEIADEENFINEVHSDMNCINELNSASLDFRNLLSNSQIDYSEKKKAISFFVEGIKENKKSFYISNISALLWCFFSNYSTIFNQKNY